MGEHRVRIWLGTGLAYLGHRDAIVERAAEAFVFQSLADARKAVQRLLRQYSRVEIETRAV